MRKTTKVKVVFLGSRPLGKQALLALSGHSDIDVVGKIVLPTLNNCYWDEDPIQVSSVPTLEYEDLRTIDFDLGISVNYWNMIKPPILGRPKLGFINVHHSYNLRIRGRNTNTFAILLARKENIWHHGTTLHYVSPTLDDGRIISSVAVPITEKDTSHSLHQKVNDASIGLFEEWAPRCWRENLISYDPPSPFHFFKSKDLIPKQLSKSMDLLDVYDRIRSLTFPPFEPPYFEENGKKRHLSISPKEGYSLLYDLEKDRHIYIEK